MLVRCTARLLKLLAADELSDDPPALDDWYANLVWIDRRKCLLLVHAGTLFPVFVADVRKPELVDFGHFAPSAVTSALADLGLPVNCLGSLDSRPVRVARTASRSVLGFMNDMGAMTEHQAGQAGGLMLLDVGDLNAFLRRTPYNRGGYVRPIDAVIDRL